MASPRIPVIGLPTQSQAPYSDNPDRWAINQADVRAIGDAGGIPLLIPLGQSDETLRALYEMVDGLCLCGGADVEPHRYGQPRHPLCGPSDASRDHAELTLTRWARDDRKPILGLCRGLQLLNVAYGGTLHQEVAEVAGTIKHDYIAPSTFYTVDLLSHSVRVAPESHLHTLAQAESFKVNSMHHQAIERLGTGLTATAWAPDGIIEAIEGSDPTHYVIAVQWHPESLTDTDPRQRRLFTDFIRAASAFRDREWSMEHGE